MNRSVTVTGLALALAIPILGNIGFSDMCSSEIVNVLMPLPGIIIAYFGRYRQGDITVLGAYKK